MSCVTGRIGPHEEGEFELFDSGQKDLIYFSYDWQPEDHAQKAKLLGAQLLTFEDIYSKLPNYIYYRQGFLPKAKELRDILLSDMRMTDFDWVEKEHRIGKLLGYSRADVDLFVSKYKGHHEKEH